MMKIILGTSLLILAACSHKYPERTSELPQSMEEATNFSFRSPENTERDEYQHPKETLEFFGITPTMSVVEVSPGAGYFTEILAPYLAQQGQLYLAVPRMPPNPPAVLVENERKLQDILMRHQNVQEKTRIIPFEPHDKRNRMQKDYADAVLVFNSVHNLVARKSTVDSFKFFYDVLKPNGVLGIVQHRVREGNRKVPESGYLYEREVIAMARDAGFKYMGKSEVNANPKDKADYPTGVWTLPPYYRLGEKDHDKYEDIGESDRMTLKFIKLGVTQPGMKGPGVTKIE